MDKTTFKLLKKFYKKAVLSIFEIEAITGPLANPCLNKLMGLSAIENIPAPNGRGYGLTLMSSTDNYQITIEGRALYESIIEDKKRFSKTHRISVIALIIALIAMIIALADLLIANGIIG